MVDLQRSGSPVAAVRALLLRQLGLVEDSRVHWCRSQNPGTLHDFRVAVRRSRTLLSQLKADLPESTDCRKSLAEFGRFSGPLRDLDVLQQMLLDPQGLCRGVDVRATLTLVAVARAAAVERLLPQLKSEPAVSFVGSCQDRLVDWPRTVAGAAELGAVVDRQIDNNLRKILHHGASLDKHAEAEQYHRLRIRGKKLRYLLEFFASLYPAGLASALVKELKKLQAVLGQLQDCSAWRSWLQSQSGLLPEQCSLLDSRFAAQQLRNRKQFSAVFAEFAGSEACCRLRGVLKV